MTISDLNAEARKLCDTDSTGYTAADLLRRINAAYEEIVGRLIALDGTWEFDDTNFTDLPRATTTLVAGQRDYSFDSTHLEVLAVDVKDNAGNWQRLRPIDKSEYSEPLDELYETDALPQYYDKDGKSIFLYPAPAAGSVTLASGLRVYFQRTADVFTSAQVTTGTKQPGFAAPYHVLLAYKAALPYCMTYKKDRVPLILSEINRLEDELFKHYARREKDVRKYLSPNGITNYQ